jgi:hypothetical protein
MMIEDLPREIAPPPGSKKTTIARLRGAGGLRRNRAPAYAVAAAIIIAIAAAIVFTQRPAPPRYILLLYESPQLSGGSREEYSAWAREMRPLIAGGEELGGAVLAVNPPQTREHLAGYFLINARDDATAARVARRCPHLKHGGAIVLRRIVL